MSHPEPHETTVRVRYGEVDRMGIVYHANYLAYFEQGRTELLRSLGRAYRDVEADGLRLVVADAGLKFLRPAGYDDVLRVKTRLASRTGVRLRFEYEVDRPADGVLVATGHTTLASTDAAGRPTRIPEDLSAALGAIAGAGAPPPAAIAGAGHAAGPGKIGALARVKGAKP